MSMGDIWTCIAGIEWISLGVFCFYRLKYWDREFKKLWKELDAEMHGESGFMEVRDE